MVELLTFVVFLFSFPYIESGEVSRIYIKDSTVPVQNSSVQIICEVTDYTNNVRIYGSTSPDAEKQFINTCTSSRCLSTNKQGASFTVVGNTININIGNVNRTRDQKYWWCEDKYLLLMIYTVPHELQLDSPPSNDQDLVLNAVTLQCSTGCAYPQPTIKWFYTESGGSRQEWSSSGSVSQNAGGCSDSEGKYTSVLHIRRYTTLPDNGDKSVKFSCGINSFQGLTQPMFTGLSMNVRFAVSATTPTIMHQTTDSRVVLENDTMTLVCTTSITRPPALVTWRKGSDNLTDVRNTDTIHTNSLVSIKSVVNFIPNRNDNNRQITCATSIPGQEPVSTTQGITVYWPPSKPSIPITNVPFLEGQRGKSIYCHATEYGNPTSSAQWNSNYGTPDNTDSRRLNLPTLSSDQNGMSAFCQLKNQFTEQKSLQIKSPTIEIAVEYTPVVIIQENNTVINSIMRNEGQGISVLCSAHGNPTPMVIWTGQTPGSAYLRKEVLDRTDHGTYTCKASAQSTYYPKYDFMTEKTLDVVVNYAPVVTVELSNTNPEENSYLRISCRATGRPADYTYKSLFQTWGIVNIPNSHLPVSGVIDIQHLHLEDSGTYTCLVNNGITDKNNILDQTGNITVKIKASPKLLLDDKVFVGAIGKTAYVTAPFYSYPDIRHFEFRFPNGTQISNSYKYEVTYDKSKVSDKFYGQAVELEGYIAVLKIKDEVETDFVNYTLVLDNGIGPPKEWIFEHIPVYTPQPPENVIFEDVSLTETSVNIKWSPGFDGYFKQTFVLRLKKRGEPNWLEVAKEDDGTKSMNITVTGLADGTSFVFQMYSKNSEGRSPYTETSMFTTIKKEYTCVKDNSVLIVGVVLGVVIVVLVIYGIYVTVALKRKYLCMQKEDITEQAGNQMYVNLEIPKKSETNTGEINQRDNTAFTGNSENQYTKLDKGLRDQESAYDAISTM